MSPELHPGCVCILHVGWEPTVLPGCTSAWREKGGNGRKRAQKDCPNTGTWADKLIPSRKPAHTKWPEVTVSATEPRVTDDRGE